MSLSFSLSLSLFFSLSALLLLLLLLAVIVMVEGFVLSGARDWAFFTRRLSWSLHNFLAFPWWATLGYQYKWQDYFWPTTNVPILPSFCAHVSSICASIFQNCCAWLLLFLLHLPVFLETMGVVRIIYLTRSWNLESSGTRSLLCAFSLSLLSLNGISCFYCKEIPVVPHKAVAEVSKIGNL